MSITNVGDYVVFQKESTSVNQDGFLIAEDTEEKIGFGIVISSSALPIGKKIFYFKNKAYRLCDKFAENFVIDIKYVVATVKEDNV